jgi:flavodoxin II
MTRIGLFYGSSTSHTEYVADDLRDSLNEQLGSEMVDTHNVGSVGLDRMLDYEYLILGIPTWDIGELQADWDIAWADLEALDLTGRKVAVFGVGDQYGYPDTYQDAAGILAETVLTCGAQLVGYTSPSGHEFENSLFVEGDQFMGLALDEDNQPNQTAERLKNWAAQLVAEFGLAEVAV